MNCVLNNFQFRAVLRGEFLLPTLKNSTFYGYKLAISDKSKIISYLSNGLLSSREVHCSDKNADIKEKITINTNTIEIPDHEEKVIN